MDVLINFGLKYLGLSLRFRVGKGVGEASGGDEVEDGDEGDGRGEEMGLSGGFG